MSDLKRYRFHDVSDIRAYYGIDYYRADEVDALLKHREQVYLRARQELIAHSAQLRNQLQRAQATLREAEDETQ